MERLSKQLVSFFIFKLQHIAHAADSMEQFGFPFGVEFGTQAFDGCFHHVGVGIKTNVPNQFGDDGFGNDLRLSAGQDLQQGKFFGGEVEPAVSASCPMRHQVDVQIADVDVGLFFGMRPAGDNLQARQQFQKRKRFDKIVVGPGVERLQTTAESVFCCQHNYRRMVGGADGFEQADAVEIREHDVQNDGLILPRSGEMQTVQAVHGNINVVTLFA